MRELYEQGKLLAELGGVFLAFALIVTVTFLFFVLTLGKIPKAYQV